jgi:ATP/maltotriose-dependent transcriptional regulator MalT
MHSSSHTAASAKISRPEAQGAVPRQRLNRQLEAAWEKPIIWISSPAGSGKTTLVSSYLREQKAASIWYQCDQGDADLSNFFYYLAMASRKTSPRASAALPLLTPEYLLGIPTFTKRFFEELGDCFPQHAQGAASPVKPSSAG